MLGERVARRVGGEVGGRPRDERVDLDAMAVALESGQTRANAVLQALAAGEPTIEPHQRASQRLGLANLAAEVGIGHPQRPVGVLVAEAGRIRANRADVAQAEVLGEASAILERLWKQAAGIEENYRHQRINPRQDVE